MNTIFKFIISLVIISSTLFLVIILHNKNENDMAMLIGGIGICGSVGFLEYLSREK